MNAINVRRAPAMVAVAILIIAVAVASAGAASGGKPAAAVPPPAPAGPAPPLIGDTGANLQTAFAIEVNTKQNYVTAAKVADREGYPAVARLFRACACADQVHADRDVQAIAWTTGAEAHAYLDRPTAGTTSEQLAKAIADEQYQVEQFYPPLIARARAEHRTMAVRSLVFALSAEREHLRLLSAARDGIGQPAQSRPLFVCPYCGRTVEVLDFAKCPNCFTPAKKFIRVT
jgi:rubrerythrin